MPAIYLQEKLEPSELQELRQEHPHYTLLGEISDALWPEVEVFYGDDLSEKELSNASRLRWIHVPNATTEKLCLGEIQKKKNILVTITKGQNIHQMAEFVIGAVLAFAKQFFHWTQASHESEEFWQWPLRDTMWTLKGKTFLQVGLGEVGSAIVKRANAFEMRTWGVRRHASFHSDCRKTFRYEELHSLLPSADVVVLALPKRRDTKVLFGEDEFKLMKNDAVFIVIGSADHVDEAALAKVAESGKFRGVLLDAFRHPPPAKHSPLWSIPNGVLTPTVAAYPETKERISFRSFRRNLRLFIPGNINEMKDRIL